MEIFFHVCQVPFFRYLTHPACMGVSSTQANKNPPFSGFGLFAVHGWPAFESFVIVSFPVGKIGRDAKERFNIECEIGSIFEHNPDCAVIVHGGNFDSFNDLATDNRERVWFASLAGTCNLALSHCRLLSGALVRGVLRVTP
jgi:hypothetical protein